MFTTTASQGGPAHVDPHEWASGEWYVPGRTAQATAITTTGWMYFIPWLVRKGLTVSRLAIHCTAGAANAIARAGIYGSNGAGAPLNRLAQMSADVLPTAVGSLEQDLDAPLAMTPGLYFTAVAVNQGPTLSGTNNAATVGELIGQATAALALSSGGFTHAYRSTGVGYAGGSLPAVAGGLTKITANQNPVVGIKVA